ncbi:hypothetical protein DWG14_00140 [Streptomyces griseorubiginosus]|uniref:Uncharacterized protein n=1 Tax=Streptomyces griseorubiginosus TaxID=67304 RepID=A0AAI8PKI4_9ACTN|nr:hypothetical protein DWG14_00140 [Streptomyces griseorubiginosus]
MLPAHHVTISELVLPESPPAPQQVLGGRGPGRGSGRCLGFWAERAEGEECLDGGDEGDVVVPAGPGAAFEVVESQAVFELAVVMFDPPAHLRPPHQVSDGCGGGQVRHPVARRRVLALRPFDQEVRVGRMPSHRLRPPPDSWAAARDCLPRAAPSALRTMRSSRPCCPAARSLRRIAPRRFPRPGWRGLTAGGGSGEERAARARHKRAGAARLPPDERTSLPCRARTSPSLLETEPERRADAGSRRRRPRPAPPTATGRVCPAGRAPDASLSGAPPPEGRLPCGSGRARRSTPAADTTATPRARGGVDGGTQHAVLGKGRP